MPLREHIYTFEKSVAKPILFYTLFYILYIILYIIYYFIYYLS
jgi:hypothetical protein